ncbi:glycoside hydrolase family 2 TIM barrel-domain containing protein [Candidatus Neomarinimicrobiota bacterium]
MKYTMITLYRYLLVFLLLTSITSATDQLDPDILFQHPWTPIHEKTIQNALDIPSILNLEGVWDFWPDLSVNQAMEVVSGKPFNLVPTQLTIPASTIGWGFDAQESGLFIRTFMAPKSWSKQEIRLKCEGTFERAQIFLNGEKVTDHVGWTPYELNITNHIRPGLENTIAVYITMEGYAPPDRYRIRKGAYPDLGGILRPIWMHAVPRIHAKDIYLIPKLDDQGEWILEARITMHNSTERAKKASLKGFLISPTGEQFPLEWLDDEVLVPAGDRITRTVSGPVSGILPWTAETPNLYHFIISFDGGGKQSVAMERFGFRTVEIVGESLLVNGRPVTFRGIAYKGGHADYGNASPYSVLAEEVELMKRANVNAVRLGWAFKAPALHRVCDEKGMYVMSSVGPDQFQFDAPLAIQQYCEAFMCLKNSPSVLIWELQNENPRTPTSAYLQIMELSRRIDPHRKFCHPGANYEGLDFICPHYLPRLFVEDKRDGRPFLPTEYAHTPSYELEKLKYDPGIHDLWGYSLKRGWDIIRRHPWVIGSITFAWRDPYVRDRSGKIIPALHHESRWGVVDESFRLKPEYHHLFKVYAPVQLSTKPIPTVGQQRPKLTIENRYDFKNLSDIRVEWEILDPDSTVQQGRWNLDVAPHARTEVIVPAIPAKAGKNILRLSFWESPGRLVQRVLIPYAMEKSLPSGNQTAGKGKLRVVREDDFVKVLWHGGAYWFDDDLGLLRRVEVGAEVMDMTGPDLNQRIALPRAGRWFDWKSGIGTATENWTRRVFALNLDKFEIFEATDHNEVRVETVHQYQNGSMRTVWSIHPDGGTTVTLKLPPKGYGVSWRFPVTSRHISQEMKKANRLHRFSERLSWRKIGLWTWYPDDHLGRNTGVSSFLNPHDPQNHAMKINAAFVNIGPMDKSINMVIRDPAARIHVKCHFWYNEFEVFVQGRLEDDYDYFDRTNPLRALPHALSEEQRTYSFQLRFVGKEVLSDMESHELDPYEALINRSKFWTGFVDDLTVESTRETVKGLSPNYLE